LVSLGFEDADKFFSDDTPFLFRLADAAPRSHEIFHRIHGDQLGAERLPEDLHYLGGLTLAQHAGVHKDGDQLIADGAVYQRGGNG
jgi:hypothetical protein